jgi:hypothetical protein
VHDHRLHADKTQEDDVGGKLALQVWRRHCRTAVLDDDRLAPEATNVGHRLKQGLNCLLVAHRHVVYSALRVT